MRKCFLILALSFATIVQAQEKVSLCGEWLFVADSADYSAGLPAEAMIVNVPHTYNTMEGLEDYAGRAWYERGCMFRWR